MSGKLVLNMDAATEDFFSDTAMIGIGSAMPGHKFCWTVNKAFNFNFTRQPVHDVEYKPAKDHVHFFSLYQHKVPYSTNKYLLYALKSEKKPLLPEIKQLDFLWLIQSPMADTEARLLTDILRNVHGVQLAQVLSQDKLRNLDHLLI